MAQAKAREAAEEKTALTIARINHINQKGTDHFLKLLLEKRADLAGLPFIMGDACRLSKERGRAFREEVVITRDVVRGTDYLWFESDDQDRAQAHVAAIMQMLAAEDAGTRRGLAKHLKGIDHKEATRALTRLAVFSFEEVVRQRAWQALEQRPAEDSTEILLAGLRYPWPAVAANAGQTITHLGRKDLVPQLLAVLDEPDPRAPVEREINGKKTLAVRELIRINHHRNCLLCHPPGNTPDMELDPGGQSLKVVAGAVPTPGHPFPSGPRGTYDPSVSPDILVRADVTYLRQDFSRLERVEAAAPWPEMQRFDYLVRTRPVTSAEAGAYQRWLKEQGPDYLAPHQRAALAALRTLTGKDASEPTAKAWQTVLEK
jgi:hypothetical protein